MRNFTPLLYADIRVHTHTYMTIMAYFAHILHALWRGASTDFRIENIASTNAARSWFNIVCKYVNSCAYSVRTVCKEKCVERSSWSAVARRTLRGRYYKGVVQAGN